MRWVDEGGAPQAGDALLAAALVEVNHREAADGDGLVAVEAERGAELLDRGAEVSGVEQGGAEQGVGARRERVEREAVVG